MESELDSLKDQARNRRQKIEKLKRDIHSLEDKIANPPEVEDVNAIRADEVSSYARVLRHR